MKAVYFYNKPTHYLYLYDIGAITITGSYGKNPPRQIKFTKVSLESYTDQLIAQSYEDSYSSEEKGLAVSGVVLE